MPGSRSLGNVIARGLALILVASLAGSCTNASNPQPRGREAAGGTLRVGADGAGGQFYFALDPQNEYSYSSWELLRCCLLRTLMSYGGSQTTGTIPQPDLASGPPEVSSDGLTWTFHLRPGLHYGPPLQNVQITTPDIVRALLRAGDPSTAFPALSRTYLFNIQGFSDYWTGKSDSIAGLEAPDPLTLRIHLVKPDASLPYDMALETTAPIPPSPSDPSARFGVATGHDRSKSPNVSDGYGRFLVSSGPYMIQGEGSVDFSKPPSQQTPPSGFKPWTYDQNFQPTGFGSLTLVRNPSWDPATDPLRPALANEIVVKGGSPRSVFRDYSAGEVDMVFDDGPTQGLLNHYLGDPSLRNDVQTFETESIVVADFNLSQPPFDDIAVRRAVAYALNRRSMLGQIQQGYIFGSAIVANHFAPETSELALDAGWSPFPNADGAPDMRAARQAMSASRYGRGGRCVDAVCRGTIVYVNHNLAGSVGQIRRSLAALGIEAKVVVPADFYNACLSPARHPGICVGDGWFPDYPSVGNMITQLFGGNSVAGAYGLTRLGATKNELVKAGAPVTSVPTVDPLIQACNEQVGMAGVECWTRLDQYIATQLMPSVPLAFGQVIRLTSPAISSFSWDQGVQEPALDRLAVS
jgi:peptide/nickel transport system substrate-binding protein